MQTSPILFIVADIAEKVVAFYAYDTRHPITATSSGLIVLHQIYTNVGDGFNTQTGHFTAPVSGLYQFHSNFMAPRQEEKRVKRSDDPAPLEVVVDKLSQQVNTLTAQVAALTDRQSKSERAVAFHSWNNARTINTTPQGTIILTHVQTNIGNAYDSHTGFFTAPVSGLYFFHATFMDSSVQDQVHAGIYVDDTMVASSTSDARHGYWDNPDKVVAFHAYESSHPISSTASGPIVLHNVFTNVGDGFDTQTGYFTAPMSGLYQFHANFMSNDFPQYVHAAIMVDQLLVAVGISDSRHSYFDDVGIAAVVHVNAGQRVFLKNVDSRANSYYGGDYTSFSGFLLRAD
nr:hypothetical protein BaRGS_008598 [Batillaria attramentaria]